MRIKPITPEDLPNLYDLNLAFNGPEATTPEAMAALFGLPGEITLIAYVGDVAAGFICGQVRSSICYDQRSAEITELYVRRAHRRQGIAEALLREMETLLTGQKASRFIVATGDDNTAARRFYQRCGYTLEGEVFYAKEIPEA